MAGQLDAADMAELARAGYKSVIINRPDFEAGPDQPASDAVMDAARQAGLQVVYQPVVSSALSADDVRRFEELLDTLPQPILAYCRSGARCLQLYQLAQASQASAEPSVGSGSGDESGPQQG